MKILKKAFFIFPILITILFCGYNSIIKLNIAKDTQDADGLVWKDSVVRVKKEINGELENYSIKITGPDRNILFDEIFSVNFDMWGYGFVCAMQADDDPEKEILAWSQHSRDNFVLDYKDGKVIKEPFDKASLAAKALKDKKVKFHNSNRVLETLLILFSIIFYISYGIVFVSIRIFRRMTKRKEQMK